MLDGVCSSLHRIRHVTQIPGMYRERQLLSMSLLDDGLENRAVQTIEDPGASARFEYGLNAVNVRALEFVNLRRASSAEAWEGA